MKVIVNESIKLERACNSMLAQAKLSGVPTSDELNRLWLQARKRAGTSVAIEVAFNGSKTFRLVVKCYRTRKEPLWTIYKSDSSGTSFLDSLVSSDLEFVAEYIENQCTREVSRSSLDALRDMPATNSDSPNVVFRLKSNKKGLVDSIRNVAAKEGFEGNVSILSIDSVLQSLAMSKSTGRLNVRSRGNFADVFVESGEPVHAVTSESAGDSAILDLLTWTDGVFKFFPDARTTTSNLHKKLEKLLLTGVVLIDQKTYLTSRGVHRECVFEKSNKLSTEEEFLAALNGKCKVDKSLLMDFYADVEPNVPLFQLVREHGLVQSQWLPVVYTLLSAGIINVARDERNAQLKCDDVDQDVVGIEDHLREPGKKCYSKAALKFLLQHELRKTLHSGAPVSLLLFAIAIVGEEQYFEHILDEVSSRIIESKRAADVVARFDDTTLALLLYDTDSWGACFCAKKVISLVNYPPITSSSTVQVFCGMTTSPDDAYGEKMILATAEAALATAVNQKKGIVLYSEIASPR